MVRAIWAMLFPSLLLLAGCATGPKLYQGPADKNLTVEVEAREDTFGESKAVVINVSRINEGCSLDFLGKKGLQRGKTQVGLPAGQEVLLEVRLNENYWMSGGRSTISRKVFLVPEPDQHYGLKVSYVDNLFGVRLYKGRLEGGEEVESYAPPACFSED